MEPPSYEEARLHPPALSTVASNVPPPPSYDASLYRPPTPPPTYGEAVTVQPGPFPVLLVPTLPQQTNGTIIHPVTQVGVRQPQPAAVVSQPQPVPVSVTHLGDVPGLVRCPHCNRSVTTDVVYVPGRAAWCTCFLLSMMGLICGCCLIPFMIQSLKDAHHSCPRCGNHVHTHRR
ncbi:lipopolysaccharide-induced tumor necrosis factor-alpha factor homolog [Centropristis striata]|uniref:lipopolysaccharide-induced tumor necrosis factor-alpha factor homolog n=1 Tax=Centropristis striata TaxID=184440 RepID=UPI0027DF431B|nr:lipopolysaccharide-induced tumor necrosis factor-alpha factor homolog [Centropristis striata]